MESATETTSVQREIAIAARPETVWEFLVDEDKATRWMGLRATFDPRPGGDYLVDVIPADTAESHTHGWDHYLGRLAVTAGGGDAGDDPWISGEM